MHGGSNKVMVVGISKSLQQVKIDYAHFVTKFLSAAEINTIVEESRNDAAGGNYFVVTWKGLNKLMDTIRKNLVYDPTPITK